MTALRLPFVLQAMNLPGIARLTQRHTVRPEACKRLALSRVRELLVVHTP